MALSKKKSSTQHQIEKARLKALLLEYIEERVPIGTKVIVTETEPFGAIPKPGSEDERIFKKKQDAVLNEIAEIKAHYPSGMDAVMLTGKYAKATVSIIFGCDTYEIVRED